MSWWRPSDVGFAVRSRLAAIGHGARFFLRLVALLGPTLRRFALVRDQIHVLGNYSLAIIAVSGLFVGFVLALQGYEAKPTAEGVSRATTRTVVMASLAVLGLDFVLTALMFSY